MYELFVEIGGVPEDIFASSDVLQKWFSVGAMALTGLGMVLLCWTFVSIFRIFLGGRRRA